MIIQSLPKVEILTPFVTLREMYLGIERAGRTCYQSSSLLTLQTAESFIRKILRSGHESIIEHSNITVKISDCSRGLTHELVRHRLASFSQQSTRYVNESDFNFILPPDKDPNEVEFIIKLYQSVYKKLLEAGWKKEDARQFLPIGLASEIVVSANFREWRHIFLLRTAKDAHWEIRSAMTTLLRELKITLPAVFEDFERYGKCSKRIPIYKKIERRK